MAFAVAVALLVGLALPSSARAQDQRDPIIDPPEGAAGSRFQVVGAAGWVPGETVTLTILFTTSAEPLTFTSGLFEIEQTVTVLRDGTWSFPVVVNDALFGAPLPAEPGYVVVRAASPSKSGVNAYVVASGGRRPAGAEAVLGAFGWGPPGALPAMSVTAALFALGVGALLAVSGWQRRTALT
jgi:hypothetical protein